MQDQGHGQPVLYLSSRLSPTPSSMKGICPQGLGTTLYPLGSGCLWGSFSGLPSMNDSSFSLLSYPGAAGADFSLITELLITFPALLCYPALSFRQRLHHVFSYLPDGWRCWEMLRDLSFQPHNLTPSPGWEISRNTGQGILVSCPQFIFLETPGRENWPSYHPCPFL